MRTLMLTLIALSALVSASCGGGGGGGGVETSMQEMNLTITGDAEYNGPTGTAKLDAEPPYRIASALVDSLKLSVNLNRVANSDTELYGEVVFINMSLRPPPFGVDDEFPLVSSAPERRASFSLGAFDTNGNPQFWDSGPKSGTIRITELNSDWIGLELINVSVGYIPSEINIERGRPTINGTIRLIRTDR